MSKLKKKRSFKIIDVMLILILIIGLTVAGVYGFYYGKDYLSHKQARDEYEQIKNEYTTVTDITTTKVAPDETVALFPEKDIDWYGLKTINKDYIGWLYFSFEGNSEEYSFTLDYPIVYETYKNQYLRTTFEGNSNSAGTIFMDMSSNPSFYGYNDIIYGHHMRDDSMFGALELIHEMDDLDYIKEHPQYLYIYTKTACHKYMLVAYEQTTSAAKSYGVAHENETYDQLKDNIKSMETYIKSDIYTWRGRPEILNLSTCDGPSGTNQRFALHFVKINAYTYDQNATQIDSESDLQ